MAFLTSDHPNPRDPSSGGNQADRPDLASMQWLNAAGMYAVRIYRASLQHGKQWSNIRLEGTAYDPRTPQDQEPELYRFITTIPLPESGQPMKGKLYDLCWFASLYNRDRSPFRDAQGNIIMPDPETGSKSLTNPDGSTRVWNYTFWNQFCYTPQNQMIFYFLLDQPHPWGPTVNGTMGVDYGLRGVVSSAGLSAFDFASGNTENTHKHQKDFLKKLRQPEYTAPQKVPLPQKNFVNQAPAPAYQGQYNHSPYQNGGQGSPYQAPPAPQYQQAPVQAPQYQQAPQAPVQAPQQVPVQAPQYQQAPVQAPVQGQPGQAAEPGNSAPQYSQDPIPF